MNVFDVAKYILHELGAIQVWKLHKLIYYCQAWSLVWDDEPLFEENFYAWDNGPVCKELYEKHIGLYRLSENDIHGEINGFTTSRKKTMGAVLDHYGDKEPYWLRELVREEDPWKKAKEYKDSIITKESMFEYYSSLTGRWQREAGKSCKGNWKEQWDKALKDGYRIWRKPWP